MINKKIFPLAAVFILHHLCLKAQPVANTANIPNGSSGSSTAVTVFPGLDNYNSVPLRNYIRTYTPQWPLSDPNALQVPSTLPVLDGIITTAYFDGLGRPLQEVAYKGNGTSDKDLTTVHVYDNLGRESVQYLPFSSPNNGDAGKLKLTPKDNVATQYNTLHPGEEPYSKSIYDNSPLNRLIETQAPGSSWVGNTTPKGVTYDYQANTTADQVHLWTIGTQTADRPGSAADYADGELFVTVVTDEDGKMTREYKDKSGKVVCKRVALVATPNTSFVASEWAQTYSVYDDMDRLRYVLSPEAIASNGTSISATVADGLCYKYFYDAKGRTIEKKLPGKEPEYFVYDKRDRVVLMQDGNLRVGTSKWAATIYDGQNRVIANAIYETTSGRDQLSDAVNDESVSYTTYGIDKLMYHLKNFTTARSPFTLSQQLSDATLTSRNYYDDYNYSGFTYVQYDHSMDGSLQQAARLVMPQPAANTNGLLTCAATRIQQPDGTWGSTWLWSVNYYDERERMIQHQSSNMRAGVDVLLNQYDFTGSLATTVSKINNPSSSANANTYITTTYGKDYVTGRSRSMQQRINSGRWMSLNQKTYDDIGRLSRKKMASGNGGGFAEDYTYNIRGWITGINPAFVDNNATTLDKFGPFFGEKISYDQGFASHLYNGNIAGVVWKGGSHSGMNRQFYGYTYDNMNRLEHAEYGIRNSANTTWDQYNASVPQTVNYTVSGIDYDRNGNMLHMTQKGPIKDPSSTYAQLFGDMDVLTYSYKPESNQLDYVADAVNTTNNLTGTPDFRDQGAAAGNYHFDPNGNLDKDVNKNINTNINYTIGNKPLTVNIGGNTVAYVYDAAGNKLQKIVTPSGGTPEEWDYIGNCIFKNNELQYVMHAEGRCRSIAGNPEFEYDYFTKDHLGNVRAVMSTQSVPYYPPQDDNHLDVNMTPTNTGLPKMAPTHYTATMEVASANTEGLMWDQMNNVRDPKPDSWSPEDESAARLNGEEADRRIGTAIMLRVMPGDRFTLSAEGYFQEGGEYGTAIGGDEMAASLLSTLAGGVSAVSPEGEANNNLEIINHAFGSENFVNVSNALQQDNTDPTRPASHLNYVVIDENLNVIQDQSGARQIEGLNGWSTISLPDEISINQPGYLLVYTSNSARKSVYWDRIDLTQYTGSVMEESHYYPFGLTLSSEPVNALEKNRFRLTTKEIQPEFGLNWYDFGARMYDEQIGKWQVIDPNAEKYNPYSPYAYVGNNPIKLIDLDGKDWFNYDNGWHWHDGNTFNYVYRDEKGRQQTKELQGTEAAVVFEGSRSEKLGTKGGRDGYIDGEGAVTAKVTVYGPDGANDVHTYTGFTLGSDAENFGAIDEGTYSGNYDAAGKSGALKSNWTLENRGPIRMMDGAINPFSPTQLLPNGEGYKDGIFIHTTNQNGFAGTIHGGASGISVGCLLIAPADWKDFNNVMNGVKNFKVQVSRLISKYGGVTTGVSDLTEIVIPNRFSMKTD